jgi:hypothetical protein
MWFLIRSWHIFLRWSAVDEHTAITFCGRRRYVVDGTLNAEPDTEGKTCERCFQIREAKT